MLLVVGICVLILLVNFDLMVKEVKEIFQNIVDKIGYFFEYSSVGYSIKFGYG